MWPVEAARALEITTATSCNAAEVANPSGAIQRRYVFGPGADEALVWYEGAGTSDRRWLAADERGSIVAVTDGAGNTIGVNSYDEYGIPAATNIGRFQYTGQAWLPELGMSYYKARIYSPALGRFMQTDPIGYGDGINWYNYVGSDPINRIDLMGLNQCDDMGFYTIRQGQNISEGSGLGLIAPLCGPKKIDEFYKWGLFNFEAPQYGGCEGGGGSFAPQRGACANSGGILEHFHLDR